MSGKEIKEIGVILDDTEWYVDATFYPNNEKSWQIKRLEMLINTVFLECNKSVQDVYFHDFSMNMEL